MKLTTLSLILLTLAGSLGIPQRADSKGEPSGSADIPTVKFCDLLKNPKLYEGKVVHTSAAFRRSGEHVSELYCPDCPGGGPVDFAGDDEAYESCTRPELRRKIQNDITLRLNITGRLYVAEEGRGFGHFGLYHYRFLVSCVHKADVVFKSGREPDQLPRKVLRRLHCK